MKPSEELDRLIAIIAGYYCKTLKISNANKPDIIQGGIVLPEKEKSFLMDDVYGQYLPNGKILYLKIEEIPDLGMLERVIVHELINVKYGPKFRHGKKFDAKVEEVLI